MNIILGRKIILILAIVLIGSVFTGCRGRHLFNVNGSNVLKKEDAKDYTVEKTKVDIINKIDINTRIADIELIQDDDFYVEIDYSYWKEAPEYTIEDGVLYFDDSKTLPNSYSINFNLHNSIKVYLPEGAALEKVALNTSSGDIEVEGFLADQLDIDVAYGDFTLRDAAAIQCDIRLSSGNSKITDFSTSEFDYKNSYGNAKFTNINSNDLNLLPNNTESENFDVTMSSGDININKLYSNCTSISNSYGNVSCEEVTSNEFNAALSSGNIDLDKADLKDITISNSYGDVTLNLTGTKDNYMMDLDTSYGKITMDGKDYDEHLIVENGGSRSIDVDLSSGDVKIDFSK